MIYFLYGQDDFSIHEALSNIKAGIGSTDLLDADTTVLQGPQTTLAELSATCDTVPFLAPKRLIIVEGLLSALEDRGPRRRGRGSSATANPILAQWKGLREYLNRMPDSTELVFIDGPLSRNNPLLSELGPLGRVLGFPSLTGEELRRWIRDRVALEGAKITPQALRLLADLVGGNLWILHGEIQKLGLYKGSEPIQEEDVRSLVAPVREASIFAGVDAILDNKPAVALRVFHQLLQSGANVTYILAMVARQVRLTILAKELKAQRLSDAEKARRLGISSGFPLKKTLEQEGRFSLERLKELHHQLLETDLSIKTGALEETIALELLVVQLCSTKPGGAPRKTVLPSSR